MKRSLAALAVLAVTVPACGGGDAVEDAGVTAETGTPDETGVAAVPDDTVFVYGSDAGVGCTWQDQVWIEDDNPTTNVYAGTLLCTSEMSDPRVSGVEEWEMKEPFFYTELLSGPSTGRFEASVTLATDDGVWRGEGFGGDLWGEGGSADLKTAFYAEYVGDGAYDGLLYRVWGSQHPESNGYRLSGYIAPIE